MRNQYGGLEASGPDLNSCHPSGYVAGVDHLLQLVYLSQGSVLLIWQRAYSINVYFREQDVDNTSTTPAPTTTAFVGGGGTYFIRIYSLTCEASIPLRFERK